MGTIKNKEGDEVAYFSDKIVSSFPVIPDMDIMAPVVQEIPLDKFSHAYDDNTVCRIPPYNGPKVKKDYRTPAIFRYPSDRDELTEFGDSFFKSCLEIVCRKNMRYAVAMDPFRNFRMGGQYGIAIRMSDKVSRLITLLDPSNTTNEDDESIEDTCKDLANYAMLLTGMRANERG